MNKDEKTRDQNTGKKSLRNRIFRIISIGTREDLLSRAFDYFIVLVIFLNISVMFFETFDELESCFGIFRIIEIVTVLIFCVEYAFRIWTAPELYPDLPAGKAILKFILSADGIIDLLTILPFIYFSGFIAFRMLRVVRIFHLFRINSQYDSFHVITTVLYEKRNQIVSSVVIILILMMASSLCMYSAEHEAQPEVFRNAFSGIWWSLTTIFTVGYGISIRSRSSDGSWRSSSRFSESEWWRSPPVLYPQVLWSSIPGCRHRMYRQTVWYIRSH